MARLYPVLNEAQLCGLPSQAEATVYRCCRDRLDDTFIVIHGKSFIAPRKDGGHKDGEADFIIFSESHGLLTIEVKGGGVTYDPASGWSSIDRNGVSHEIKDPIAQAKGQKFAVLNQLKSNRAWIKLKRQIVLAHAVLFPDIDSISQIGLLECPLEILGGRTALKDLRTWIDSVFKFWSGPTYDPLGSEGIRVIEQVFCSPIDIRPMLRDTLAADDKVRIRLTNEQASVLRTLGRHRRAAIVGAAGTGKTILAIEKARMLAELGSNVLFLCYNKALGAHISRQFPPQGRVTACTFHQFCRYCVSKCVEAGHADPIGRAKAEAPKDDFFDVQLPLAAFYAVESLGESFRFDAIVVDEGQDFGEEYWLPIEMVLQSSDDSWLYIFYDENQRLYSRVSSFPIPEADTYPLTRNCRNSTPIHELAYRYYMGETVDESGIAGLDPIPLVSPSIEAQARSIGQHITKLIHEEQIAPDSIAVLLAVHPKESFYSLLCKLPLPRPVKWSREEHFLDAAVLMDTVKRFKGLEREIIFLWLNGDSASEDALMYVGISRAKSVLYLVGNSQAVSAISS